MSETFYRLNTILFKDVHMKSQEKPRYSKENSTALKRTRDTVILMGRKRARRRGKRGARTRNVNLKIKKNKKKKNTRCLPADVSSLP
jgi:hypothetical protein